MRKYEGNWHVERQSIFPDYVFLESEDGERLAKELEQYQEFLTIFWEKDALIPVQREEEQFLQGLCGQAHHFGMSKGYIRGGRTYVTEGPLQGKERLIRRIDRHKRIASLEMPDINVMAHKGINGNFREMQVGLEIVSKS